MARSYWERVAKDYFDWLRAMTGLALALYNATNNTSLVVAIELSAGGKVLLFPGRCAGWELAFLGETNRGKTPNGRDVTVVICLREQFFTRLGTTPAITRPYASEVSNS